ncbi:SH2 domain-containing protein 1A isoform X1 [Oryzias melastigma]|uniref:SH2 domain-containing protein n=1 Tax=Oryzias melastigma TaxID=30732 RepID=A0A3B3DFI2_ORYME|nr:SH2 domain-containing protein 1A isoform X1 [Oryzias melastigma]
MEREGIFIQSIYYGKIGRMVTERLLERFGHDGSFLLRDSETVQGAYCLCVRKAPFVHTYRLLRSTCGWSLQDSGESLRRFEALESLINHYRRVTVARVVPLTAPLDKTQIPNGICEGITNVPLRGVSFYFSSTFAPTNGFSLKGLKTILFSTTEFLYMEINCNASKSND